MSHEPGTPLPAALDGVIAERPIRIDRALLYLIGGALEWLVDREPLEETGTLTVEAARLALSNMLWDFYQEAMPVSVPIGTIMMWPSLTPPDGWLLCGSGTYARADYPDLYDVLDSVFHVDADNFILPSMNGRFPYGAVSGAVPVNQSGGQSTVTLTENQIPAHTHALENSVGTDYNRQTGGGNQTPTGLGNIAIFATAPYTPLTTLSTGGGASHENMPPYRAVAFIIKAL